MYKWLLFLLSILIYLPTQGQNNLSVDTDSLEQMLNESATDTARINLLNQLSRAYVNFNPQKAALYIKQALKHTTSIGYRKGLINLSETKGQLLNRQHKPVEAIAWYKKADSLLHLSKNPKGSADCQTDMAKIYARYGDVSTALQLLQNALKINEAGQYQKGIAQNSLLLGDLFARQNKNPETLKYFRKAAEVSTQLKDSNNLALAYQKIGQLYLRQQKPNEAKEQFQKALKVYRNNKNKQGTISQYHYLGLVQQNLLNTKKAIEYFEQSLQLATKARSKLLVAENYFQLSLLYLKQDKEKSLSYTQKAYDKSLENNDHNTARSSTKALSTYYNKQQDYNNSLLYQKAYQALNDSLLVRNNRQKIAEQRFQASMREQKHIKQLSKLHKTVLEKEQSKAYLFFIIMLVVGIGLLLLLVWLLYKNKKTKNNFQHQLQNKKNTLAQQATEIAEQKEAIDTKNSELKQANKELKAKEEKIIESEKQTAEHKEYIYDSKVYTSEIQKVLLPDMERRGKVLPDHFILFKPREILSGDFYWVKKVKPYIVMVTADCSGHGVPSAVVGMLAISFLNNIVHDHMKLSAGEILDKLREKVKQTIKQGDEEGAETKGRIEMALAMYDLQKMELQYAGAYNALHIIRPTKALENFQFNAQIRSMQHGDYTLLEVKADKQPVGRFIKEKPFATHRLKLEENDKLYMFTNGYVDQPNYKNRLFNKSQLKNLLLKIHQKGMNEQQEILSDTFEKWKGDKAQIDDLLVMGVSIDKD